MHYCTRPLAPLGNSFDYTTNRHEILILRAKFRNRAMLFDETLIELSNTDIHFKRIFCLRDEVAKNVMKKNGFFFDFNTDSRISLCARAHHSRSA